VAWRTTKKDDGVLVLIRPDRPAQPSPSAAPSVEVQPEPAPVVAQLKDGAGVMSLDQQGELSGADNLRPSYQELVKRALTSQRIERSSQLQGLTRPPSTLMGGN